MKHGSIELSTARLATTYRGRKSNDPSIHQRRTVLIGSIAKWPCQIFGANILPFVTTSGLNGRASLLENDKIVVSLLLVFGIPEAPVSACTNIALHPSKAFDAVMLLLAS